MPNIWKRVLVTRQEWPIGWAAVVLDNVVQSHRIGPVGSVNPYGRWPSGFVEAFVQ